MGWIGGRVFPFLPIPPVQPVPPKERPRQLVEPAGRVSPAARVAIPREIYEAERLAVSSGDAVDVRQPGLAGGRAGSRDPLPDQRVDQARLADIRTPDERDFPPEVGGKVCRTRGARDERGVDLQ
jgi:hypothetical protein